MYKFKVRYTKGAIWLRVEGPQERVWKVYKPSEILDLLTEVECYDEGRYDRCPLFGQAQPRCITIGPAPYFTTGVNHVCGR